MRKSNKEICPICQMIIDNPHTSCQINCLQCSQLIPNLNYYVFEGLEMFRFCSEDCKNKYEYEHKEKIIMQIGQRCLIKSDGKVIEVKVYKLNDLSPYSSGDTLTLIDDNNFEYVRHYWEIKKVDKNKLSEVDLETIRTEELRPEPIIKERIIEEDEQ